MSEIVKDLRARCDNILSEIRINMNKSTLKDSDTIKYKKRINELEKYKNTNVINDLKSVFDELQSMSTNLTNFNQPIMIETVTDNDCTTSSADCTSLNLELETLKKSITLKEKADAKKAADEKEKALIDAKKKADAIAAAFSEVNEKADASITSIDEITAEIKAVDALIDDAITKTDAVSTALSPIATLDTSLKTLVKYNDDSKNDTQLTKAIDIVNTAFVEISKISGRVDPICTAVDTQIPIILQNNTDITGSLVTITSLNITNKMDDLIGLTNDSNVSSSASVNDFKSIKTGIETEIKKFKGANSVTDFHAYCTDFGVLLTKIHDAINRITIDITTPLPSFGLFEQALNSEIFESNGLYKKKYNTIESQYNIFKQSIKEFELSIITITACITELMKEIADILRGYPNPNITLSDNTEMKDVKIYYDSYNNITKDDAFEQYNIQFELYDNLNQIIITDYSNLYKLFSEMHREILSKQPNINYKSDVTNLKISDANTAYTALLTTNRTNFGFISTDNDDRHAKCIILNLLSNTTPNLCKIIFDKLNLLKVDPFNAKLIDSEKKANDANDAAGAFKTKNIDVINTEIADIKTFNDTNMKNALDTIGTPALKSEIDSINDYIKSVRDNSVNAMTAVDGTSVAPIDELKKFNAAIINIEAVVKTASTEIDSVNTTIKKLSNEAKDSVDAIKPANAKVIAKVTETEDYIGAIKTAAENAYQSQTVTGGKSLSGYHRSTNSQYNKSDDKNDDKSDYMDYDDTKQYLGGAAFGILGGCFISEYWKPIILVLCILALLYIIYLIQAEKTKKGTRNLYNTYENIDQYGDFYSDTNL